MTSNFIMIIIIGIAFMFLFHMAIQMNKRNYQIPTFDEIANKKNKNHVSKKQGNNKQNNQKKDEDTTLLGFSDIEPNKAISIKNNCKHIFVCGTTGSGKTVTLSNFIKSIFEYDYPSLIVDGKGDTGADSILDIVKTFNKKYDNKKKVYIVDMNDPNGSDKYNPFNGKSPTVIKDMLLSMSDWSEEHYKLNVGRYLQKLLYLMKENDLPYSFKNIVEHLDSEEYKKLSLQMVKDKKITKEEHLKNVKIAEKCSDIIDGAIARFSALLESDIGTIFADDGIDVPTALNENAIILIILNPLTYPDLSPIFGRLVTIDAKQGVSSLFHKKFKRTFYLLDEISIYASNELLLLVNLARSANVTSILATQSLSDLDNVSEALRKQVIESCNNYIVMRQNEPSNAETWSNTIGTQEEFKLTYQFSDESNSNKGSIRQGREFIYHPDEIKNLQLGEALFVSKDEQTHTRVKIHKPF